MSPRIETAPLARHDLMALADYYASEAGPDVAVRFIEQAQRSFARLAAMPRMGALFGFPQEAFADVRRWHIDGFPRLIVLYRALPDGINIQRVLHAARDIDSLFDDEIR